MSGFLMALLAFAGVAIMSQPDGTLALPWRLLGFVFCWGLCAGVGILAHRRRAAAIAKLPAVSVRAQVVARRIDVIGAGRQRRRAYFLTFQPDSGDPAEFEVSEIEYGRFEDGDSGMLTFRGTQYLGLRRYDLSGMAPVAASQDNTAE